MPTYAELLKDPRWQKKRLEILQRDAWTCTNCGDKDKTLHVHHRYYRYGKNPWEYDEDAYQTLCEPCHTARTSLDKAFKAALEEEFDKERALGYLQCLVALDNCTEVRVRTYEHALGVADAIGSGIDADDVLGCIGPENVFFPVELQIDVATGRWTRDSDAETRMARRKLTIAAEKIAQMIRKDSGE